MTDRGEGTKGVAAPVQQGEEEKEEVGKSAVDGGGPFVATVGKAPVDEEEVEDTLAAGHMKIEPGRPVEQGTPEVTSEGRSAVPRRHRRAAAQDTSRGSRTPAGAEDSGTLADRGRATVAVGPAG